MARPAGGVEHVVAARELLRSAKTAEELRRAQAVLLPLDLGLSLEQTARAIGRSVNATCAMRTRFARAAEGVMAPPRAKTALRNLRLRALFATAEQDNDHANGRGYCSDTNCTNVSNNTVQPVNGARRVSRLKNIWANLGSSAAGLPIHRQSADADPADCEHRIQ